MSAPLSFVFLVASLVALFVQIFRYSARAGRFGGILRAYDDEKLAAAEAAIRATKITNENLDGFSCALALVRCVRENRRRYVGDTGRAALAAAAGDDGGDRKEATMGSVHSDGRKVIARIHQCGAPGGDIIIRDGYSTCGDVFQGVSVYFEDKLGGFAISWPDFEAAYLAVKAAREATPPPCHADIEGPEHSYLVDWCASCGRTKVPA